MRKTYQPYKVVVVHGPDVWSASIPMTYAGACILHRDLSRLGYTAWIEECALRRRVCR